MFTPRFRTAVSCLVLMLSCSGFCQLDETLWQVFQPRNLGGADSNPAIPYLSHFAAFRINSLAMQNSLDQAPMEFDPFAAPKTITLPMPSGVVARFRVIESPILSSELAERIPVRTYLIQGVDDRYARGRIDFGPFGFHGMILSPNGDVIIDPIRRSNVQEYLTYFRRDSYFPRTDFACLTMSENRTGEGDAGLQTTGPTLKIYRLAMSATTEYTAFFGGVAPAQAAVVTSVNRVTGVYESDCAVRLNLTFVMCWTGADPFSNGNGGAMLGQNQSALDTNPGNANYDIGHVFSTGGGGVAGLNVVGITGQKARGVTGGPAPVGDVFDIDYVAHEMGHQYGGRHSFNGTTGSCGGNRDSTTAYEPGSGSTVMSYAGICGSENLQPNSDAYFHTANIDQIVSWRNNAASGGTTINTGNLAPTVNAGADVSIPQSTPFKLTASAADGNGDPLTFCWEQFNLGTASPTTINTTRPLFRSFTATVSPTRIFPRLADILSGAATPWEILPNVNRSMTFRCTVRDNKPGGGGVEQDSRVITVSGAAMSVTSPNTNVQWVAGSNQTVTWNVGGSAAHSANVNILLSTNGGTSYGPGTATVLASNVPNDGSQAVTLPAVATTSARIFVESANGVFFDVSNVNFQIVQPTISGTVTLQDFEGAINSRPVTIEIRAVGSTTPLQTHVLNLNGGGTYSFAFTVPAIGTYDLTCKGTTWLRKRRANVVVTATGAVGQSFSLINGDVDGDNEVTLVDFGALSAAFGSIAGNANWNVNADLNGDGEVNLVDYGVVAARFSLAGDD